MFDDTNGHDFYAEQEDEEDFDRVFPYDHDPLYYHTCIPKVVKAQTEKAFLLEISFQHGQIKLDVWMPKKLCKEVGNSFFVHTPIGVNQIIHKALIDFKERIQNERRT